MRKVLFAVALFFLFRVVMSDPRAGLAQGDTQLFGCLVALAAIYGLFRLIGGSFRGWLAFHRRMETRGFRRD